LGAGDYFRRLHLVASSPRPVVISTRWLMRVGPALCAIINSRESTTTSLRIFGAA
jgi:hypothetical protein